MTQKSLSVFNPSVQSFFFEAEQNFIRQKGVMYTSLSYKKKCLY